MIILVLFCLIALCGAVVFATQKTAAARAAAERAAALESELAEAREVERELVELKVDLRGRDEQLTAEQRIAREREGELARLREEHKQDRQVVTDQSQEIKQLKDCIDRFQLKQEELAKSTLGAAESNQRIETTLLDWTRKIASPQGRGAFGELALRNQLLSLGLQEGRDFSKQVTPEASGRQRVDFVVRLGDSVVAIDSKLANDPGLNGLSEALAAGDPDRLKEFGRKLREHAKALARKDYWKGLEKSPSLTFMYVPIEGAMHALAALDDFDATKFFNTNRVCVITPSQLAISMILVAEVSHAERKEEHIEDLLSRGYTMAEAMSNFLDNYAKLGKKLGESVTAFNGGAAMVTTHGQVWQQVVKPLSELAPSKSIEPKLKELEPPREDVVDLAERYRVTSDEMRRASEAA
ncbi:MAG TPA: DNA recombination protein RmuC [Solirubrobacterales bacterium]|jgi:DNA recombination protein RmuC|nr:DNA recombination protein RmuC [Solirubrobacterales bacterium]